jgi:hypothetical protein
VDLGRYGWYVGELAKFSLLGCPADVTLWKWKRRVPSSKSLYYASWCNFFAFLLWLLLMLAVACIGSIASNSQLSQWVVHSGMAITAVFIPLLCFLGSVLLFILSFGVKKDERPYSVLYSVLMVILWIASVVAPN